MAIQGNDMVGVSGALRNLRRQPEDLLGEVDWVLESKVVQAKTVTEKPSHSTRPIPF